MQNYIAEIRITMPQTIIKRMPIKAKDIDHMRLNLIQLVESRPMGTSISNITVYKEAKSGQLSYIGELFCGDRYHWFVSPDDKRGRLVSENTGKILRRV